MGAPRSDDRWIERINPQVHLQWSGSWRAGTVEPPRILIDHELVVVASGTCVVGIDREDLRLDAGDWLVVPPGVVHATRGGQRAACIRHCLHFDWDWQGAPPAGPLWTWLPARPPAARLRRTPTYLPPGILRGTATPEALTLARRLHVAWSAGDVRAIRTLTLELLLRLLRPHETAAVRDPRTELARQVKDLLDARSGERFLLREECADLGVSYEHLCRCFTRVFGVSPQRYLLISRIERAKRLLGETNDSVALIAERAGFGDASWFAACFRRATGLAPAAWRAR